MIDKFISNTKGLTKNPLGIIALFISLIYGFACLVLSTSISNLNGNSERLPLIWFIISFPIIILIAFIFLVVKHHEKLYSPSDYRNDDSFIKTIDREQIVKKQMKEVQELEKAEMKTDKSNYSGTTINEKDNKQTRNKEENVKNKKETKEELLSIYKNAEKWATIELSLKYNVLFKNNLAFSIGSGRVELDAYGTNDKASYIAEIKYWKSNKSDRNLKLSIQKFLAQHERLEKGFGRNKEFKLIVVLVFDNLNNIDKNNFLKFVKNIYNNAYVEFFDYEELRKNYE